LVVKEGGKDSDKRSSDRTLVNYAMVWATDPISKCRWNFAWYEGLAGEKIHLYNKLGVMGYAEGPVKRPRLVSLRKVKYVKSIK